jgi:hypothetical protein
MRVTSVGVTGEPVSSVSSCDGLALPNATDPYDAQHEQDEHQGTQGSAHGNREWSMTRLFSEPREWIAGLALARRSYGDNRRSGAQWSVIDPCLEHRSVSMRGALFWTLSDQNNRTRSDSLTHLRCEFTIDAT